MWIMAKDSAMSMESPPPRDESYQVQDLHLINAVLRQYPAVDEVIRMLKFIASKVEYPVPSLEDLAESLGGPEVTLKFQGHAIRVAELKRFVPPYYFPISNQNDAIAKFADLVVRRPGAIAAQSLDPVRLATGARLPAASRPAVARNPAIRPGMVWSANAPKLPDPSDPRMNPTGPLAGPLMASNP
jgi:hypothetical protein